MKYTENYKVKWHDTGADRNVRLSQYLVYMQETANLQLLANGTSLDGVRDEMRLGFILSKIKLIFHKKLTSYEDISVNTWTCPSRGFTFSRCFEIEKNGEKAAEAISFWALLNIDTRTLTRVDGFELGLESEAPLEIDVPRRIKPPKAEPLLLGKREIRYSDIDYNMHMNNTKYPDMLCDFMPMDKIGRIREMTLEFLHESALGDTLSFFGANDGDRYFFKTVNQNGDVCLTAEVVTDD